MAKELSGPKWVARFPDSGSSSALDKVFRTSCESLIAAMRASGITVQINSTRRPSERAYLMHYCWRIHRRTINPQNVPSKAGVDIDWVHRDASGHVDLDASRRAAAMVSAYGIAFQPALKSLHVEGRAIDMSIRWSGNVSVKDRAETATKISSTPRNGFNPDLRKIGKTYGVVKHPTDPPHWSTTGK